MARDALVVLVTCPPGKARGMARKLVAGRVAACVNVIPGITSAYRWKGAVQEDRETLLLVKTTRSRFAALKQAVLKLHPYDLPEVIALAVDRGHAPYLRWLVESAR